MVRGSSADQRSANRRLSASFIARGRTQITPRDRIQISKTSSLQSHRQMGVMKQDCTIPSERICRCTRMRRFFVRFNRSESFVHTRSSAGFTIITAGFDFSVHTSHSSQGKRAATRYRRSGEKLTFVQLRGSRREPPMVSTRTWRLPGAPAGAACPR